MTHGGSKHVSHYNQGTAMPKNHDALDCVADLARMLDYCEARLAQTESVWLDHVAATRTVDGNPATRGTGHGWSAFGGARRGPRRQRGATPSAGRYTGDARRPRGEGGAMNARTTHYTKRAAQRAISWGDKRRPD